MLNLNEIMREYESLYNKRGNSNFSHVTHNLMTIALISDSRGKIKDVNKSLDSLEKYLLLLDEFPEFKERELTQNTSDALGSVYDYVRRCDERLRKLTID